MNAPTLILVTDPRWSTDHVVSVIEKTGAALVRGALSVQLRDKSASLEELARTAARLRKATSACGASLIVNTIRDDFEDVVRLAIDAGADGLHVACDKKAVAAACAIADDAWISVPAHTDDDVKSCAGCVEAMLVSPIFETPGKGKPRGPGAIAEACRRASFPGRPSFYGLGGVDGAKAAKACAAAGADGVAVVRALLDAADVAVTARALDAAFRGRRSTHPKDR